MHMSHLALKHVYNASVSYIHMSTQSTIVLTVRNIQPTIIILVPVSNSGTGSFAVVSAVSSVEHRLLPGGSRRHDSSSHPAPD